MPKVEFPKKEEYKDTVYHLSHKLGFLSITQRRKTLLIPPKNNAIMGLHN